MSGTLVWCVCVCVCVCVDEPGPKTKALRFLILFGGGTGRYWSKEYQKNFKKFKICIIMHKICIKYAYYAFSKNA